MAQTFQTPNSRLPQNSNSLIVPPNSLIEMQQFPAPAGREFISQPPCLLVFPMLSGIIPANPKNSLQIPVDQGI